jgi:hypothetical protein
VESDLHWPVTQNGSVDLRGIRGLGSSLPIRRQGRWRPRAKASLAAQPLSPPGRGSMAEWLCPRQVPPHGTSGDACSPFRLLRGQAVASNVIGVP